MKIILGSFLIVLVIFAFFLAEAIAYDKGWLTTGVSLIVVHSVYTLCASKLLIWLMKKKLRLCHH